MAARAPDMIRRLPLTVKFVATLLLLVIAIGLIGGKIYVDRKTVALENELALQIVAASRAVEQTVSAETSPSAIRRAMKFLSVFAYVKCADVFDGETRLVSWPIPTCKPIIKKFGTQPAHIDLADGRSMILHIDPTHIETLIATERQLFSGVLSTILLVVSLAITGFLIFEVSQPLSRVIGGLRTDDDGQVSELDVTGGREIRSFITAYNLLVADVQAKTAEISRWRKRIRAELDQADSVQQLLVQKQLSVPPIEARNKPLTELSGDFYEAHSHADGRITFLMGDVAGKGIYAAMMLAQTLTAFRAAVRADDLPELLVDLYSQIEDRFPDGLFVALTLARLSADGKTLDLMNIGNPDCIILKPDQSVVTVPSAGPAIGILPAAIYTTMPVETITMTGTTVYLFTDGISELDMATLTTNSDFANIKDDGERLIAYFRDLEANHGAGGLDLLMQDVAAHSQDDDVTIARIGTAA